MRRMVEGATGKQKGALATLPNVKRHGGVRERAVALLCLKLRGHWKNAEQSIYINICEIILFFKGGKVK